MAGETDEEHSFRLRFRFLVAKPFNLDSSEVELEVGTHRLRLSSPVRDQKISDSRWLVMNASGFASVNAAHEFGRRLKSACDVASISTRLGVDSGVDKATSALSSAVKKQLQDEHGAIIRDNIHGIDVFPDDPSVCIFTMNGTGKVSVNPQRFFEELATHVRNASEASARTRDVLLLMNYALMRPEPVAQIVFSFSAVEMVGQNENWTESQKALLKSLSEQVRNREYGDNAGNAEVAEAIAKLHKLSLRQGVLRLLDRLGLAELRNTWDDLYARRSTLVHGLAPEPGVDYGQLAQSVVSLCGRILLSVVAEDFPGAEKYIDAYYPVPDVK